MNVSGTTWHQRWQKNRTAWDLNGPPDVGPPFQVSENDLRETFGVGWEILHLDAVTSPACDQKILGDGCSWPGRVKVRTND